MKVLYNNQGKLLWKEANWDGIYYSIDDNIISQTDILAVKGLQPNKYVKCKHCGAVIRNTPTEIAKHKKRGLSSAACFDCRHCSAVNTCVKSEKYTKLENGKYAITKKTESKLVCKRQYGNTPEIDSSGARLVCMYNGCTNASYPVLKDFFQIYPHAFDELITADKILENGYKQRTSYDYETLYILKARNSIMAHVNKQNIVTHFSVSYKDYRVDLMYSSEYNKFFTCGNGQYAEWNPSSHYWPDDVQERIKNKIASLYN